MAECFLTLNLKFYPLNRLSGETSPYLLQHAHNPVNWYPWSADAWNLAKQQDKLVLVSIGYSSCHWCHVMERESFEDAQVASLMNEHYICVKVDREERPDVDQVYMTAVQLMTGSGGWPLNCFCLPDGRPLYGGTYYPKANWMEVLSKLNDFYRHNKLQAEQYASELVQGVQQTENVVQTEASPRTPNEVLRQMVNVWRKQFDYIEGGPDRAPKFPMPNNYAFLLHYSHAFKDEQLLQYVLLTLDKMAFGGIYDHVGGGFARYSTDRFWKVPHFEKMLYDNAQLVSLFAHAYQLTQKPLYKEVVYETLEFIRRDMTAPDGTFYSALDADSEGEEGKFYVWKKEELPPDPVLLDYFNVNKHGLWEGNYILLRMKSDEQIAEQYNLPIQELGKKVMQFKSTLLQQRNRRIRPGLDNKVLTSWNALMISGYCDAYDAFGEKSFLQSAEAAALQLLSRVSADGAVQRLADKDGFLDDYCFLADALIALYRCTFKEEYLHHARTIVNYTLKHFFDMQSGAFWYTSDISDQLFARKKEIHDNVIPSSNSGMAKVLFLLGKYFDDNTYSGVSVAVLNSAQDMQKYPSAYSNWAELMLRYAQPFYEVVIMGPEARDFRTQLANHYIPNKLFAGTADGTGAISLLEGRFDSIYTRIFICQNNSCRLPVTTVKEALQMLS